MPLRPRTQTCLVLAFLLAGILVAPAGRAAPAPSAVLPVRGSPSAAAGGTVAPGSPSPAASLDTLARMGTSPTALSLEWAQTADLCFSQYTLEYSTIGPSGPWAAFSPIPSPTATSEYVWGLQPSTTHWWAVVDTDCTGASTTSNVLEVAQPPVASLRASLVGPTSVAFNWTNAASYGGLLAFGSYQIMGDDNDTLVPVTPLLANETTRAYMATGLAADTSWDFYLVTIDDCPLCNGGTYPVDTSSNLAFVATPASLRVRLQVVPASAELLQPTRFTCNATGGEPPLQYAWDFGDGSRASSTSGTENHTYRSPGSFDASCTVTDRFGTQSTGASTATVTMWWVLGIVVAAAGAVAVAALLLRRRRRARAVPATVAAPPPSAPLPQAPAYPPLPPPPGPPPPGP